MKHVPDWSALIQGAYGTKCYYPFENDDVSLAAQVEKIQEILGKTIEFTVGSLNPRIQAFGTRTNSFYTLGKEAQGGWRAFLTYPYYDKDDDDHTAGCYSLFTYVHDEYITRWVDPTAEYFNWEYDKARPFYPPARELWGKIREYITNNKKLPIMAVYNLRGERYSKDNKLSLKHLEKHREAYRDSFSFCRYVTLTRPDSVFGRCPEQLECGLVNLPALHPLVKNFVDFIQTLLRALDKEDKGIRKDFMEDDEATFEALNKEIRTLISSADLSVLLDPNSIARDVPCLHINYEYRAMVKKNWNLVLKKMAAEKKSINGIKRHLREALILHARRRQPTLQKKTKDGTKFELRQLGQNCGCSAPFFKTLTYIQSIIQATGFEDDGMNYEFDDVKDVDIKDMSERNFLQAFMASCDFGINLVCSTKCKCICPKGAVCSGSSGLFQLPSVGFLTLLLVFQ